MLRVVRVKKGEIHAWEEGCVEIMLGFLVITNQEEEASLAVMIGTELVVAIKTETLRSVGFSFLVAQPAELNLWWGGEKRCCWGRRGGEAQVNGA